MEKYIPDKCFASRGIVKGGPVGADSGSFLFCIRSASFGVFVSVLLCFSLGPVGISIVLGMLGFFLFGASVGFSVSVSCCRFAGLHCFWLFGGSFFGFVGVLVFCMFRKRGFPYYVLA